MIREWFARAAEVRDLRDRAVLDARLIRDLNDELDSLGLTLARRTAALDQATAQVRDLDTEVQVLTVIAHQLGVTCIHPLPGGDLVVHIDSTKETP